MTDFWLMQTIDRKGIAQLTGYTLKYVTDNVTKRPDFPKPAQALSQRNVRWALADIHAWIRLETRKRLASVAQ